MKSADLCFWEKAIYKVVVPNLVSRLRPSIYTYKDKARVFLLDVIVNLCSARGIKISNRPYVSN